MTTATNPDRWLTAKRLRAHGTILALCLWGFYAWNLSTPGMLDRNHNLKGTDFLHLYTLGAVARSSAGVDLYEMNAQAVLAAQRVPQASGIRYLPLYPPQVSIFFAPLAYLPYGWSLIVWWVITVALYAICCYAIWRACPNLREHGGTVFILAAAFPAFFHLIAWGQTSAVALACFTLLFFLLRDKNDFLAGIVLGCLIFKPQLGLAAAVVFVVSGAWKTVLGATLSAAAQLYAGVLYYGWAPLREWIAMLRNVRTLLPLLEPKTYQTHSLRTFWSMLIPAPTLAMGLYVLSAIIVSGIAIAVWKRPQAPFSLHYSSILLATVLIAPHLTVYDLVILAPAFLVLADWMIGQIPATETRSTLGLGTILYLAYMLPLIGPFARWIHIQLSVIAMAAALWSIWRLSRKSAFHRT